eukprot:scaffold195902_cov98-Attheya_sp.AAC.1
MPSKIRIGCVVSGATGELYQPDVDDEGPRGGAEGGLAAATAGEHGLKKQKRRRRRRRQGTVIESVGPNRWMVLWGDSMERSDHPSNVLRFISVGNNIRRGTMPPECRTAGVGVFAAALPTPVSVVETPIAGHAPPGAPVAPPLPPPPAETEHGMHQQAAVPEMVVLPPGAPVAPPLPPPPPAETEHGMQQQAIPEMVALPIDPVAGEEEHLLIPTADGLGRQADEEQDDDGVDIDQMDPGDFEFENADDRFSNEELLFEYDDDLAAEMEKGREMVDKMINATNEKRALMGTVVQKGSGGLAIDWTVREDVTELEVPDKKEYTKVGVRGFKFGGEEDDPTGGDSTDSSSSDEEEEQSRRSLKKRKKSKKQKASRKKKKASRSAKGKKMHLFPLLRHLWPGDWRNHLAKMNAAIVKDNSVRMEATRKSKDKRVKFLKEVSENEFWVFHGIMIAASLFRRGGMSLWPTPEESMKSLWTKPDFSRHMTIDRFKVLKRFAPSMFHDEERRETDPWWQIVSLIEDYNANRQSTIAASRTKIFDELMSAFRPQTSKFGNLPHLSYIKRKPEDLGTECKNAACSVTGINLFLEIQRGKLPMRELEFNNPHKPCAACTLRLEKGSLHCGQRFDALDYEAADGLPPDLNDDGDLFYGDSWFASVETATHTKLKFNSEFVGPVKTAHSRFPRKFLEDKMKTWPGGTWLVLEGKGRENVDLLAIGYKYNSRKVLCFIATKGAGHTEPGEPYEARWTDKHRNTHCRLIARPSVISGYFIRSNCIDKHNHTRQGELKLEKKWVTMDGYFRIFTTVLGITVIDSWKAYQHHIHARNTDKNMLVLDFAERLSNEMLMNSFSTLSPSDVSFNISPLHGNVAEPDSPRRASPRRVIDVGHCSVSSLGMSGVRAKGRTESVDQIQERVKYEHRLKKRKGVVIEGGKGRVKRSKCAECSKKSTWVCNCCVNVCLCTGECAQIHIDYFTHKQLRKAGHA